MSEQATELSFERAEYADAPSAAPCGECKTPLETQYWTWQGRLLCEGCRAGVEQTFKQAGTARSFGKAVLWGGLTALGCGVAYAIFVAVSDMQLALATIGIAFVIAGVVRKASRGIGGRRYQILAVALTYGASAMGYGPAVWQGIQGASAHFEAKDGAKDGKDGKASAAAASEPRPQQAQASAGDLALALVFMFGLLLAAPFLTFGAAPIGFLIVLFGLWEAWKLSQGVPLEIAGPYRVGAEEAGEAAPT